MGVSDRWHFAWLGEALDQFERDHGRLRRLGGGGPVAVAALAEQGPTPPLDRLTALIGRERARVDFYNKYPAGPAVKPLDLNDLRPLSDNAYDLVTLSRASMFITETERFLADLARVLRPGGLAVIDWLHGLSNAPLLSMPGGPRYGGDDVPFRGTYADARFLAEFPGEFEALIRHVNRPPWWVDLSNLTRRRSWLEGLGRVLTGAGRRDPARDAITLDTYLPALESALARGGKRLIGPAALESHFKVLFRHARYFYPHVKKFNLYLLTVLSPSAK